MAAITSHRIDARDKPGFLHRVMTELAGGARMTLEGDLSACHFPECVTLNREEVGVLRRNTLAPRLDFVVLRLDPETVAPIFEEAKGAWRGIIHVQIERDGVLQLGAYDEFHHACTTTGPQVSPRVLAAMRASGVIRSFEVAACGE